MSDYIGVVTNIGQAKIAAAIGGTALNLATIRVGDGNGAPIVPNAAMADLVRRVGAAYPIISSGRDPVNANHWRVTALIPVADGPFDIREIGVWDAAGDMIAVAKHVLVEKRTPAQGAAVELLTDIVFPVSETAQVTVQVTPSAQISIFQMLRAGFTVVESATVANPPGAPALGRTHVVPAGPTGAWVGLAGYLVQWNGIAWVAVDVPAGFVVVDQSKGRYAGNRWLERTATGWDSGLTRFIQRQPGNYAVAGGTANSLTATLDPAPANWADLDGVPLRILLSSPNTGAATLAITGLATGKPIVYNDGSAPQPGDLTGLVEVIYRAALDKLQITSFSRSSALNTQRSQLTTDRGAALQLTGTDVITRVTNYGAVYSSFQGGSTFSGGVLTIGAADAGLWFVAGHCRQPSPNASGQAVYLYRNGTQVLASDGGPAFAAGSIVHSNAARVVQLAAGDTVEMRLVQTTGADFTFNDIYSFSAVRLGA